MPLAFMMCSACPRSESCGGFIFGGAAISALGEPRKDFSNAG
jgi:hypothetical protein